MNVTHIRRRGRRILAVIGVLAVAALTVSAGIALADDGDDGGGARVTSSGGTVTVPLDGTGAAKKLPLTQITVSGHCQHSVPPPGVPFPGTALARALVEAAPGKAMDAFSPDTGTFAGQSLLTPPFAFGVIGGVGGRHLGSTTLIVTSNRATAAITMGGRIDLATGSCAFVWQAVESRNS